MFDNWDDYVDALEVANNATGTLQEQQDIYMESMAAHLQQLETAWEGVYDSLFDTDAINNIIDALTSAVEVLGSFVDSANAGLGIFPTLGLMVANIFNNQIGGAIEKQITNLQIMKQNEEDLKNIQAIAKEGAAQGGDAETTKAYKEQFNRANALLDTLGYISEEDYNRLSTLNKEINDLDLKIIKQKEIQAETKEELETQTFIREALSATAAEQTSSLDKIEALEGQINLFYEDGLITAQERAALLEQISLKESDSVDDNGEIADVDKRINDLLQERQRIIDKLAKKQEEERNKEKEYDNERSAKTDSFKNGYKDNNGKNQTGVNQITEAKRIAQITEAVSGLTMAYSSLSSVINILNNDELDGWERFSQIASNLVVTLPMLIKSFDSISKLPSNLSSSFIKMANSVAGAETSVTTLGGALTTLLPYIGAIAGVAAVVAGITIAVQAAIKEYNAASIAAERAAETASDLATANEEIESSLSDLQNLVDTYDSAKETLEDCTEGTEEWKDALEDTNEAALELINSLSNLSADDLNELYSRDENGLINIDEDKLDELISFQESLANASDLAAGYGTFDSAIKSAQSDLIDATREAAQYSANRYQYNSGGIASDMQEQIAQEWKETLEDNATALTDLTNGEFATAVSQLGLDLSGLSEDQIADLKTATEAMAEESEAAAAKLKLIADLEVSNVLGDDYDAEVQEMVSNQLIALTDSYTQTWQDLLTSNRWSDIAQEDLDAIGYTDSLGINRFSNYSNDIYQYALEMLQQAGYDYTALKNGNEVKGTDDNRSFVFLDENGKTTEWDAERIAKTLGAYQAMADLSDNAEEAAAALSSLEENAGDSNIADSIKSFITNGNFEDLTKTELTELQDYINSFTGGVEEAFKTLFGEDVDLSQYFGEDYANNVQTAIDNANTALNSYLEGMFNSTQEAFAELGNTSDLSTSSGEYIADALQGAIIYGTEDTLDTLQDTFNSIEPDELDDFAKAIEDVDDWSSLSADDLLDILDSADVSTELTTEELEAFIQAMSETSEATAATTESLQETYASLHEIIDGLETGDTISSDDYTTLIDEVGDQASSYFTMMLDGTYKLTGDAEDFYDMVQSQQIENFTNQIEDYKSQMNQLQSISEEDLKVYADATKLRVNETREEAFSTMEALGTSKEQIAEWRDEIESLKQDIEDTTITSKKATLNGELQAIYDEIADTASSYNIDDIDAAWESAANTIRGLGLAIAESAEDYDQLKQYLDEGTISAESFSIAYQDMWDAERTEDLDSDELEDYANYLQEIADESDELSKDLIENDEAAEDLAAQIMNMNDAVEDLSDNWEDWSDILKNSSKESEEYADTIISVKDAMSKLLDIDNEFISNDLILNNMEDIEAAANGDADAIDRLRAAALEDIIINLDLDDSALSNEQLALEVSNLQAQLDAMGDLQVGAEIDDADFIAACNDMIDSANLTVDQVNALFSAMGYEVNVETKEQPVEQRNPRTTTVTEVVGWSSGYATNPDGESQYWEYPKLRTSTYNDGYSTETGMVDAIAMTSDGTSPVIKSVTKKATGSSNNSSSRNAGGNSSGNSGSSGGSGGGGGSSSEPDTEDPLEDEIDRYHDINLELQKIATTLSRLQNAESKLTGQALLDNLNEQISTLNDQIDATTRKMEIAEEEANEYKAILASQGVTFDEDGYITNYAAIVQEKLDYVNECIAKYNAMSATEQEAYKDTLEDIKEDYQDFVDMISDYDTLISDTIPGLEDDIRDALDQQIELEITKFTMEVEIRLDMTEAEQDWNEFYRKVILGLDDDDILGNAAQDLADILSYFNTTASDITDMSAENLSDWIEQMSEAIANGGTGSIQSLTDQLNDTLDQLAQYDDAGWMDVYGDDQAQALEDLQTYYTELMSQLEDVEDLMDDIEESYLDMIDEAIDAFDEQVDQYEYINDLLNHDVELISLLYGDDAYEQMAEYYAQIEANNNQELDFLRQRVDYAYQMMQAETDDEARAKWQEEWEDALEELNDKVEDSVENLIDQYSNTINQIINELNDAVTNGLGLDYIGEEWDLINERADIYLDEINSMYEIQALQQKYLDAIDDTDSIAAQQKLNDLMEEQVAYLQDKENLTEYDVERAEKLYEIALAQIALDEAQQNKSTMRLRRDSQGNYSYEYVADDNAVAEAQQELLTLQNELYNFDKDAYQENLNEMYSVYEEYQEKLLDLYEDQTLSAEEREAKIALYAEEYGNIINALVDENAVLRENLMDSAFDALASLYDVDVENFKNMSAEEQDELMNSLVPQWDSAVQDMVDVFAGEGGFIPTCQDAFDALDEATEDYEESLDDLESAAGIDLDTIASGYDEVTEQVQELIYTNEDLINQYSEEINAIQNVMSELSLLIAQYQSAQAAAEAATAAAYAYWQAVQKANAAATDTGSSSSSGSSGTSSGSASKSGITGTPSSSSSTVSGGTSSSGGGGTTSSSKSGITGSSSSDLIKASTSGGGGGTAYSFVYDTGGYTGDWDTSDGKLAILHEKELVLNASDTENILNTVGMVRDISSLLSNLNSSAFDKIISYMSGLNGSLVQTENASDILEQNVHIDATFTDATTAKEIEDAFNSLINVASQYAYRNTR